MSEVAELMKQIDLENEAARRGLYGLAEGRARHDFIISHMERVAARTEELVELVGEEEAFKYFNENCKLTGREVKPIEQENTTIS
jgi:hypothetical protein